MANPSALQAIDLALRGGVVILLLLVAALLMRDYARAIAARLGAAFALGVSAYAVYSSPGFAAQVVWWHAPILALSAGNPVVFWLLARALFDDTFESRWWHGALWSALAALGIVNCFVLMPSHAPAAGALGLVQSAAILAFAALAVGQTLSSWRADLVEGRRRLRVFVVAAAAIHVAVTTVSQLAFQQTAGSELAGAANALALALISIVVAWQLVRTAGDDLFAADPAPPGARRDARRVLHRQAPEIREAVDPGVVQAIERVMVAERAYREENLTIGALAARLGLQEYKLRRAINQNLGYRNFNVFLNRYRIEQAKTLLADPAQIDVSVLDVAMDCGFQSLGPFNRAFKSQAGQTPTEFRRLHAGSSAPERLRLADSKIG